MNEKELEAEPQRNALLQLTIFSDTQLHWKADRNMSLEV